MSLPTCEAAEWKASCEIGPEEIAGRPPRSNGRAPQHRRNHGARLPDEGWQILPQWVTLDRMQTVAETPLFSRQAAKLFSEEEKRDLIDYLAENPMAGDEIPGTEES